MARARNNISRLPVGVRTRISQLLDDGATYAAVSADAEVAAACAERRLTLHDSTYQAWVKGAEHRGYCEERRKYAGEVERRKIAAYVVTQDQTSTDLVRIANYELLKRVLARLESGEELETRDVKGLTTALAAYDRNRIAEASAAAKRQADAEKAQYEARIAELEAKLAELTAAGGAKGASTLSDGQVAEIKARLGLK